VQWTKFYNHGGIWGGAIVTSDNGILARTGSTLSKRILRQRGMDGSLLRPSTYFYYAPVEVSDGYIYTTSDNPGRQ
jgi:hypothetical protein